MGDRAYIVDGQLKRFDLGQILMDLTLGSVIVIDYCSADTEVNHYEAKDSMQRNNARCSPRS
jgi:hypothetical protein